MVEPAKNGTARTLETPAAKLVATLLPTGNMRINRVMEKVLSCRKSSRRRTLPENFFCNGARATRRA